MGVTAAVVVVGTTTVADVAAAVAVVGMVTSVAGMVTHNQTLTQVGAVMSLAGGIASIGMSMGAGAATTMGDAAVADTGDAAANTGFTNVDGTPMNVNPSPNVDPSISAAPTGNTTFDNALNNPNPDVNGASAGSQGVANPASTTATPGADNVLNSGTGLNATNQLPSSGVGLNPSSSTSQLLSQGFQQSDNSGTGLMNWFNNLNAGTKSALVQGLAGGIGGLSNAYSAQQKLALEQLINSQSYQKYQTALANSNSPSTISYTPAASNPSNLLTGTQNQGLINSASKSSV